MMSFKFLRQFSKHQNAFLVLVRYGIMLVLFLALPMSASNKGNTFGEERSFPMSNFTAQEDCFREDNPTLQASEMSNLVAKIQKSPAATTAKLISQFSKKSVTPSNKEKIVRTNSCACFQKPLRKTVRKGIFLFFAEKMLVLPESVK